MALTAPDILKSAATAYVLRGLTLLAAYLAQKGLRADDILTPENLAILALAAVTFAVDGFVVLYRKARQHNLVEAAKESGPGDSMGEIKAAAAQMSIIGSTGPSAKEAINDMHAEASEEIGN